MRCFMRTNRTPDEWNNWCLARNRMDEELKQYYRACTTGELPPQLIELSKRLDCFDALGQKPLRKWFADEIVRAHFETEQFVDLLIL